jgi:MFS family permease
MRQTLKTASVFLPFYLLAFIFTLHVAVPSYINSTYLAGKVGEVGVGLLFAGASLTTLIAFFFIGTLLKKRGDYDLTLTLLALDFVATLGLAALRAPWALAAALAVNFVTISLIHFDLDVLLESLSKTRITGTLRGNYLTVANVSWVISPFLVGFVLKNNDYWRVYATALVFLAAAFVIFRKFFRNFADPEYRTLPFRATLRSILRRRNIRLIFGAGFILQFFYACMVIYTPLYLHNHIGFDWQTLGIIFSIALLPFLLLEGPLGRIADRWLGEKEFLAAGFVFTAVSTAFIALPRTPDFALWVILLFATRVGASMIEIMSETYFFKRIGAGDAHIVALYRSTRPVAYIAAPIAASLFLAFLPFPYLFVALGIVILSGLAFTIPLKDTK